jgi:DNA gyrase/topoisomerase IV subunit B
MAPFTLFARAVLAYSVHEHQEGHASRIDVWVHPETFTVQDDGRGMGLDRDGYVEGLMGQLVGRPGAVQLHGVGLSLIAASTPRLAIESCRGDSLWRQTFAWGIADGPPQRGPAGSAKGTRITLFVAPGSPGVDSADLLVQIDVWRASYPQLTITLH